MIKVVLTKEVCLTALDNIKDNIRCRDCVDNCNTCSYFISMNILETVIYEYFNLKKEQDDKDSIINMSLGV